MRQMKTSFQKIFFALSLLLCAATFFVFATLVLRARGETRRRTDLATAKIQQEAARAGGEIERKLRRAMEVADSMAGALGSGALAPEALSARLREALYNEPDLVEVGTAFAPFAFDPSLRLHGEAFAIQDGEIARVELDALDDYTKSEAPWYQRPLADGPTWLDPAPRHGRGLPSAIYAVPFHQPGSERVKRGVLYVAVATESLTRILDTLDLGENGYGFVLSAEGAVIAHPNHDYVDIRTSIFNVAARAKDDELARLSTSAIAGHKAFGFTAGALACKPAWVAYEPVPATRWSVGLLSVQDDIRGEPLAHRRELMRIGLAAAAFLALLGLPLLRVERGGVQRIWVFVACASAIAALSIGYLFALIYKSPDARAGEQTTPITGAPALRRFLAEQSRKTVLTHEDLPLRIRTGIFVQAISFINASDVRVSGYVWQKYEDGVHDEVTRGFILPENQSAEIVETYRQKEKGAELVGWSFKAVLHQDFDYSRYPFGQETIAVQIAPKDFYRNVILVPDLASHKLASPCARPGLREGLSLPGWEIIASGYGYRDRSYQSKFGFDRYVTLASIPELRFEIQCEKQILGAFVTHLLPVLVVLIMLFIIVMLTSRDANRAKVHGFDTMKAIQSCAGFFLVVIFSHIDLRKTLAVRELVYLENFHLLAYCVILSMSVNVLLFGSGKAGVLGYRDNLVPKLLYWPLIGLALLTLTLRTFY
jgi:hypothetical protein